MDILIFVLSLSLIITVIVGLFAGMALILLLAEHYGEEAILWCRDQLRRKFR